MAATNLKRAVNELGAKTTYQLFLEREAVPAVRGFHIEDINSTELYPWARVGGRGVYLNLDGAEGVDDCYICEIAPGQSLEPQKHMFEALIYVVSGRGATTIWQEDGKNNFRVGRGRALSPPLNAWYRHFNGQGDKPVRLLAMTNAPTVLNLYHNIDFVFNCDYRFIDRYAGEENFFSGEAKVPAPGFHDTNFIADVRRYELPERNDRGAGGRMLMIEMANNVMSAHISQFPVATYKKAHRHGAGAHVIILKGEGFSVMWREGDEIKRYNWRAGSLLVPPERWFHQHFNTGGEPARYLALKPFSSRKFPGLRKQWGTSESVKLGAIKSNTRRRAAIRQCSKRNWPNAAWRAKWAMFTRRRVDCEHCHEKTFLFANRVHRYLRAEFASRCCRQSAHLSNQPQYVLSSVGSRFQKEFFKDEGLDVEIIRMNVPNIITALVTGDVAYTLLFGSVVRGALRGVPMRALASLLDGSTHALVAKPEYKSGKQLKGKIVGIGNFGGTDEVAGRMMLKSFGLDTERDLKFIALGPDRARLAALKEGLVDVAVIAPPGDALGGQMGFNVLLRAYEVFSFPIHRHRRQSQNDQGEAG